MSDPAMTRSVSAEKIFNHPLADVWRALTDSEWLSVWFFPNDVKPEVGHKFTIWSRPIERWDGEFKCQILEVDPEKKLRFSWSGGHPELKAFGRYMETEVVWTLGPAPEGGTLFSFVQNGVDAAPEADAMYDIMAKGAASVLNSLTKRLPQLIEHGA